jgi:hypothetical protein
MSFGARTRTFPPHNASSEPPTLAFTLVLEGFQLVLEGSPLELVVLARFVIYVMGQPSIQRGHIGPLNNFHGVGVTFEHQIHPPQKKVAKMLIL